MNPTIPIYAAALAMSGCAVRNTPVVDARHPASPNAPEARSAPMPRMLGTDAITRRTRELIAARTTEMERPADSPSRGESIPAAAPSSAAPASTTKKPTGHEHH
jgi:hypothetical protein